LTQSRGTRGAARRACAPARPRSGWRPDRRAGPLRARHWPAAAAVRGAVTGGARLLAGRHRLPGL